MTRPVASAGSETEDDRPREPSLASVRPARRRGLAYEVAEQLLELIAASPSAEVALPPERQLCEQLEVSRNVLREALAALDQMGLIETRGKTRVGITPRARVQQLSRLPADSSARELLADPIEVRRIIEPETAALAAMRASPGAIAEIERWLALMERGLADGHGVVDADSGFHVSIARATDNRMLIDLVGALSDALRRSRELSFRPPGATQEAIADHRAILDAIRARDAEAARLAMREHLEHVASLIRSIVSPDRRPGG